MIDLLQAVKVPGAQAVQTVRPADDPKLPARHELHSVAPAALLNLPLTHAVQVRAPLDVQTPELPAAQGVGHARKIMGTYVSPRKLYRAATSVLVSALW